MADPVPQSDLKPISKIVQQMHKSESVKEFLNKSNVQKSLIKEALERSASIHPTKLSPKKEELR
jgi:hypothetical protein